MNEKKLPVFSYSKIELFEQCKHKYKLRYIDGNYTNSTTIVLDLGNIAHKGMELKGRSLINKEVPNYTYIIDAVMNGIQEETEKDKKFIKGVNEIKREYFLDFYKKNEKNNLNYEDKLKTYFNNLDNPMDDDWEILAVEQPFEFIYEDRCIFKGFIDRIDINSNGELRVVDYKTSNAPYDEKKLTTPLQMVIYTLACQSLYNKTPIEHRYDFIFLGISQNACSKGYLKRGMKKINKLLDEVILCAEEDEYPPSATPLCYWCDFASHTPLANEKTCKLCEYHCLWTPTDKTFKKKKEYGQQEKIEIKSEPLNPFNNPFASVKNTDVANPFNPFIRQK